jgi:methionyl-tRNA formyltransferase
MNIVFFGSSHFAVPSLQALLSTKRDLLCVVTQPDKKKGRGLHVEGTAVKAVAASAGIRTYQPARINTLESALFLKELKPDLCIVIAYGQILAKEILEIPRICFINAHASLLPDFRGAAPINWAIIRGKKSTGVTIMKMAEKMDAGPIISQRTIDIEDNDTAVSLEGKLSILAAELLIESLDEIKNDKYTLTPQDEKLVTFAPKLKKEDGLIRWDRPAEEIHNLIRGCLGWPGAFTHYKGKVLKICDAADTSLSGYDGMGKPGQIVEVSKGSIIVATGKGELMIKELQPEGKRIMKAAEFLAGHKISVSDRFD